jgi:hypothetical protein
MRCCDTLAAVNASAAAWDASEFSASARVQRERHVAAREECAASRKQTLTTGGWCLGQMVRDRLFGREQHLPLPNWASGGTYRLPGSHVEADELIVDGLTSLLRLRSSHPLSVLDLGAGVGQYGYALCSRFPRVRWRGFDGAGDVEAYTDGQVRFADLTHVVDVRRADWVLSLEVGEHVQREHELVLLRNLHAHACRGILLSWACYGGHQHVNKRPNAHLIDAFERLGYRYDAATSHEMRRPALRAKLEANYSNRVYGWFARSVMVFWRRQPLVGRGCTPTDGS